MSDRIGRSLPGAMTSRPRTSIRPTGAGKVVAVRSGAGRRQNASSERHAPQAAVSGFIAPRICSTAGAHGRAAARRRRSRRPKSPAAPPAMRPSASASDCSNWRRNLVTARNCPDVPDSDACRRARSARSSRWRVTSASRIPSACATSEARIEASCSRWASVWRARMTPTLGSVTRSLAMAIPPSSSALTSVRTPIQGWRRKAIRM